MTSSNPVPTPTHAQAPVIDVDVNVSNSNSPLGSDAGRSTTSISGSILKYREENGRTYHAYKDGKYLIPNDNSEQDRLDLQHHLFLLTFGNKLYICPAGGEGQREVKRVLDVGTGTGAWAIDYADEYPDVTITGVDLSPIQPPFVPPNVRFEVDDLEEPWAFNTKFDFIYSRMMTASFANWPKFFEQSFESLNPGGWLEVVDIVPITNDDGTLKEHMPLYKWMEGLLEGTRKVGRDCDSALRYKEQMEKIGFTEVTQVVYKWPMNPWPKDKTMKELGIWTRENIGNGIEGLSVAVYTRILGWSKEEFDVFAAQVRKDMNDPEIHSYWPIYVVYGKKPE